MKLPTTETKCLPYYQSVLTEWTLKYNPTTTSQQMKSTSDLQYTSCEMTIVSTYLGIVATLIVTKLFRHGSLIGLLTRYQFLFFIATAKPTAISITPAPKLIALSKSIEMRTIYHYVDMFSIVSVTSVE